MVKTLAVKHPTWVFSSYSAALLQGMSVSYHLLGHVHILTSSGAHTSCSGIIRRHIARQIEVDLAAGVRVTPPMQTAVDCMLSASVRDSLAIADSALRIYRMSPEDLRELVERKAAGRRGVARARFTARYADARAESGGESIARAVMIEEGFLIPDLQVVLPDLIELGKAYRVDFLFRLEGGRCVACELDGMEKYRNHRMLQCDTTLESLSAERIRESHLTAYGMPIARFTFRDVVTPGRLASILERFGVRRVVESRHP